MRWTSLFSTATFCLYVATAVAATGATAFRTLREKDEFECFSRDDGLSDCLQENFPDRGFSTVFLDCPETASSVLECKRCEIILTDEDTQNEIDLAKKSLCSGCTLCQNTVAYDCSNLGEGDCAIRDCQGTCTASSSKSALNNKPRFSNGLNREQECVDVPGWQDALGNACDYYAQGINCDVIGWTFDNDGYNAKGACCACGGGNTGSEWETSAPTTEETTEQTTESTIPPTPEPSDESTTQPTTESSSKPTTPATPEPSPESTIPPTSESSLDLTIPPTLAPTNPSTASPSTPRPTSPNKPIEPEPPSFSMQRFLAQDIKMTLDNVEPLDKDSSLRWQDITGRYMAVELKTAIGSKLVESVEVSVSLTSQDPPPVSRRALLGKKMSALRRLQIAEELTFDADVSIRSDLDESTVSRHIKEILEKNEYLAALRQSGDSSFANVDSVSVPPVTSLTRMEDSADNKPEIALIVGSVVAGFAVVCLAAHAFVRRRTKKMQHGVMHDKGGDSSTTVDIYVEDAVNATSSKSPSPKWLSHRLGFTKKSSFHSFETPKGTASDVDEESLFVSSLTDRPTYALSEADEESIGGTTLSSITTGFSYPAADWSLPPTRIADECTVSSYWTKDDDISVTEIEVRAPAGALGIVLETPNGGVPRVNHINSNGPLAGRVRLGDRLVAVDGRNVTSMNAAAVSRLIASKKDNAARELIFARPK